VSESSPAKEPENKSHIKEWVTLVTALTALVAGIGAIAKPQDQTSTKASYEVLSKAIQDNSTATARNHDDLVALRSYLEGYTQAQARRPVAPLVAPPKPVKVRPPKPKDPGIPAILIPDAPNEVTKAPLFSSTPEPAPSPEEPLPSLHDRPDVWDAPNFDAVVK
jgi:hypothetical protein